MSQPVRVDASPTKAFFVRMLTRDIELRDAILDLLDNCVDGIVRTRPHQVPDKKPYDSFHAEITANPDHFVIEDNCGGIPRGVATDVAFRLGRPTEAEVEKLETVGVYGIGMKRAIFKLGRRAVVTSEHSGTRFRVNITPEWLDSDKTWDLVLEEEEPTGNAGTRIEVTDLHPEIQRDFTTGRKNFLSDLNGIIRELYAVIMGKGFRVRLNDDDLEPIEFKLLASRKKDGVGINPYVFRGQIGDVHAEVIVGFYRKPLTDTEINDENESPKADLSQAGWSVICNDRLVLRSDKSAMTGWGTANVPRFHNQFSSIAGLVILRSTDPAQLPLNTTKRGIETSSDVYFRLMDYMRAGVKQFTDYTNQWKTRMEEAREQFDDTSALTAPDVVAAIPETSYHRVSGKRLAAEDAKAEEFKPELPKPSKESMHSRRIQFIRPESEVVLLARELLDDESALPSQVGEACFDQAVQKYKRAKRKP